MAGKNEIPVGADSISALNTAKTDCIAEWITSQKRFIRRNGLYDKRAEMDSAPTGQR